MSNSFDEKHDPALVNIEQVEPKLGLGSNFENDALPLLTFSTKGRIWGDKSPEAIEPTEPEFINGLRAKTLRSDGYRCLFCGFYSQKNEIHNLSDNHRDIRAENLRTGCPLCHAWKHLGEIGSNNAVIAYIPGMSAQDVNHLQRSILIALHSEDQELRDDARKLLNWMASHRSYAKDAWGTNDPAVFASALVTMDDEMREKIQAVFEDLAVVFGPALFSKYVATWVHESYRSLPIDKWAKVYHDVINAPA